MDAYQTYIAELAQNQENSPVVVFNVPHDFTTTVGRLNIVAFVLNVFLALWVVFTGKPKTGIFIWSVLETVRSFLSFEINVSQILIFTIAEVVALLRWSHRTYVIFRR